LFGPASIFRVARAVDFPRFARDGQDGQDSDIRGNHGFRQMVGAARDDRDDQEDGDEHRPGDDEDFARMLALVVMIPAFEFLIADIDRQDADVDYGDDLQGRFGAIAGLGVVDDDAEKHHGPGVNQITPEVKIHQQGFFAHIVKLYQK